MDTDTPNRTRRRTRLWPLAVIGLLAAIVMSSIALAANGTASATVTENLEFDVAEDATRFVFDDAPLLENGFPAYGNGFVTQGYIYEAGAIEAGAGVNTDGTPTHPDRVVGEWTCYGYFVGDGADTQTGAWVVTTQIFDFGDTAGEHTVVSQGFELAEQGVAGPRAIVGGTGDYRSATGEGTQVLHGFNESEGVNLSVTLDVERPR